VILGEKREKGLRIMRDKRESQGKNRRQRLKKKKRKMFQRGKRGHAKSWQEIPQRGE